MEADAAAGMNADDQQGRMGSRGSFTADADSLAEEISKSSVKRSSGKAPADWAHNSQMLAVKDERKRAEYDVQLLANRLAYLRAEEAAAAKKVADTKKRTADISAAKKQAKQHDQRRAEWRAATKKQEEANREYFNAQRDATKKNLRGATDTVRQRNRDAAADAKRMAEKLKAQKADMSQGDNARRHAAYQSVKMTHDQQKAKEAKRRFDRELELRQQFESRVNSEKARKAEAEKLIANFEAEEARLIERLKATQVEQHGELTKLEKTLLSP